MKPLELTIYPPMRERPSDATFWEWRHEFVMERDEREAKRLTESELAAEYIRAEHDWDAASFGFEGWKLGTWKGEYVGWADAAEDRRNTLLRFAHLPHASERNYE